MRRSKAIIVLNLYKSLSMPMMSTMRRKAIRKVEIVIMITKGKGGKRKVPKKNLRRMRKKQITWNDLNCTHLLFFSHKNLICLNKY